MNGWDSIQVTKREYNDHIAIANVHWQMLSHTNPICECLTLKDERQAKKRKHSDEDGGKQYFRSMSK